MLTNQRAFIAPGKYIQGEGVLSCLNDYVQMLGSNPCVVIDEYVNKLLGERIQEEIKDKDSILIFQGQVSINNTEKYTKLVKERGNDVVIGIGGGRTLDTSKVVANALHLPLIIIPTSASTDAPTSALSVIYTDAGKHIKEIFFDRSPDVVLVDTEVIAKAPVRLLVAGMGDALATFFEARANKESDSFTNIKGDYKMTLASYAIAKECFKVLIEDGYNAKLAAEAGSNSKALQNIIEVNTLLSGVGAESNGASGAHAFHDGFTAIEDCADKLHGERVAFGVICQLILENRDNEELEQVLDFSFSVGLPITLKDIGVQNVTDEKIQKAAEAVMASPLILREPFTITKNMVANAIKAADAIGKGYRAKKKAI